MSGDNGRYGGGGNGGDEGRHQPSRYRQDQQHQQQSHQQGTPSSSSNTPAYYYSYSTSAPYRLANAAAAAASPLLGYLSGTSTSSATPSQQQPSSSSTASGSRQGQQPSTSSSARRASSASYGYPLSTDEITAAATMAGSPGSSNVAPYTASTSTTRGGFQRAASTSSDTAQHRQQPPPPPPTHTRSVSSSSNTGTNPAAAVNMRRTSSISDEDARKKESRNLDSIVLQFFSKAAQVITQARFTHVSMTPSSSNQVSSSTSSASGPKKSRNRWFNLELDESDIFKDELKTWRSVTSLLAAPSSGTSSLSATDDINLPAPLTASSSSSSENPASSASLLNYPNVPSMVIEIILDVSDISPNQVLVLNNTRDNKRFRVDLSGKGKTTNLHNPAATAATSVGGAGSSPHPTAENGKCNIVLERWTLSLRPPPPPGPLELPTVYKHCIILFRALYTLVRTLPIFELHRKLKRRTGRSEIKIGCRLSTGESSTSTVSDTTSNSDDVELENELDRSEIGLDTPLGDEDDSSFSVMDFAFAPVVTPIGSLDLRCRYRACVDFSVEEIEALLSSRFIDEDFFKPTMRKYSSSSGPGSIPTRISGTSPLQSYSRSQQRQTSTSLSAGRPISQPQPVPIARSPERPEEGAFVSYGKSKAEVRRHVSSNKALQPQRCRADHLSVARIHSDLRAPHPYQEDHEATRLHLKISLVPVGTQPVPLQ
ncbi:hypothetical protein P389DRAFT_9292 [Cystobasidium minutum MCA 4210]|uniref:uncharacterized protein n=1 Tax=Cystobasidium minutum MCA 4210 TaxID=1397322 RepID=UPI0034CD9266|eukprot:jgi/Rhomi1/9292/CE9291_1014